MTQHYCLFVNTDAKTTRAQEVPDANGYLTVSMSHAGKQHIHTRHLKIGGKNPEKALAGAITRARKEFGFPDA